MSQRSRKLSRKPTHQSQETFGEMRRGLPIIPLNDAVLFPHNVLPIGSLEDHLSAADLRGASAGSLKVGVVTNRLEEGSGYADVGTEATVTGLLKLPDGSTGAVLKAQRRFKIQRVQQRRFGSVADIVMLEDDPIRRTEKLAASLKSVKALSLKVLALHSAVADETPATIASSDNYTLVCDMIAPHLSLTIDERLELLAECDVRRKLRSVLAFLAREAELQKISDDIEEEVSGDLHESHRRYYLKEQIRAMKRELGEMDGLATEVDQLEEQIDKKKFPKLVQEAANEELERMHIMGAGSPEYIISHSYVSLLRDLPWSEKSPRNPGLKQAHASLNKDHYGLEKTKEKILEYLAVLLHKKDPKGQILLLSGPPGVGKTSIAKSIAASLGRPFARIALGGVRDESEIRGHRRTYIGSMPGKIIQAIKQAKSRHGVILLDEIDKIGRDQNGGDVSSALLEVLDPEQNHKFVDHYLAVPFDLSGVIFVATANQISSIPSPLFDRMELIQVPSYTELEKLEIAKRHLVPGVRKLLGLFASQFRMDRGLLTQIIRDYTCEAGVRQLQRELTSVGRKIVKLLVEKRRLPQKITTSSVGLWLGQPKFIPEPNDAKLEPGVAVGLAYTDVGGEILYVESSCTVSGHTGSKLDLTGSLGKVMQESARTCLTFLQVHADELGFDQTAFEARTFHLHFPDGGTPKDGPSAGVAILCALASQVLGRSLPVNTAMTGEVTLRGRILPVGGIREKVMAAHRYGKTRIILPTANRRELSEIPADVLNELEIVFVESMRDLLVQVDLCSWRLESRENDTGAALLC